jgi:signal transduction histidine kinase/DNA-binding NarL/FixJ family response regulator
MAITVGKDIASSARVSARVSATVTPTSSSGWNSKKKIEKRILFSRSLVFLSFALIGALLATFAFLFFSREEENSYESQYEALADDFILKIQYSMQIAHFSTASMAGMVSVLYRGFWPYVWVVGFDELYRQEAASLTYVYFAGLTPIVRRNQVDEFNIFSENITGTLIRDYLTDQPYNESAGYFGELSSSQHNNSLILPVINIAPAMYIPLTNIDTFSIGALHYFDALDCVSQYEGLAADSMEKCSTLTMLVHSDNDAHVQTPTFFLFVPVLDEGNVVAFMSSAISLKNILEDLAPPDMPHVICVVQRKNDISELSDIFTYEINGEGVDLLGNGDLHDPAFNYMKRTAEIWLDVKTVNSSQYQISFYPTVEFQKSHNSMIPIVTGVLFVLVTVVVMSIFFIYDKAVHAESLAREVILETKKNFVRYISHEIRTPLNTVLLGLKVLNVVRRSEGNDRKTTDSPQVVSSSMKAIADIAAEVKTGASVAVTVLNDLLDYDRLDMSRMNIAAKPIPAVRFLQSTISTLRRQLIDNANLTHITFTSNLFASQNSMEEGGSVENIDLGNNNIVSASHVYLLGDVYRLAQVIRHMISNSLKYVPYEGLVSVSVNWKEVGISGKGLRRSLFKESQRPEDYEVYDKYEPYRCGVLSLSVKDNGPGISKELISEVFTDEVDFDTRLGRSKGLGLCISKQIISLHHGHIWATGQSDSSANTGTTFTIELPVYSLVDERISSLSIQPAFYPESSMLLSNNSSSRQLSMSSVMSVSNRKLSISSSCRDSEQGGDSNAPQQGQPLMPKKRKASVQFNGPIRIRCKHYRILVVDDSDPSRKIVCKLLQRQGFSTDQAIDGLQCLQMMEASSVKPVGQGLHSTRIRDVLAEDDEEGDKVEGVAYDCILLDSEMPNMNGPTAASRLRSLGYKLPIIGLTGNVLSDDVTNFIQHGADHVMFKPFNFDFFKQMIHQVDVVEEEQEEKD